MFKKVFVLTITIILLMLLAVWSPWNSWDISLLEVLGLKQNDSLSGLQVYSMNGEVEVLIDDEVVGNVSVEGSPLEIVEVEPGDHLVTIQRVSEDENAKYYSYKRIINFIEGVNTTIAYELGPNEEYSGGYLIYPTETLSSEQSYLNVRGVPSGANIYLNNEDLGESPLTNYALNLDDTYLLKVESDNYESIEFDLLPENPQERQALASYDLNVEYNLFEIPVDLRIE